MKLKRYAFPLFMAVFAGCGEPEDVQIVAQESSQLNPSLIEPTHHGGPSCELAGTFPLFGNSKFPGAAGSQAGSSLAMSNSTIPMDMLTGAPGYGSNRGTLYAVRVTPFGDFSSSRRFDGDLGSRAGTSVAASGQGAVAVGAPLYSTNLGRVYVTPLATTGNTLLGNAPTKLNGAANNNAGQAVAYAADLVAAAGPQLVIGVPGERLGSSPTTNFGSVYVFKSPPPTGNLPLASLAPDFKVRGDATDSKFGHSLAVADLDGDGTDDLIVGAPYYDATAVVDSGAVFVFYGPVAGTRTLAQANVMFKGVSASELAGYSVARAGDLDGDGADELLVGAPGAANSTGRAYLIYGSGSRPSGQISLATVPSFTGESSGDQAGFAVATAGDVSGDGHSEVLIGAPGCRIAGVPGCPSATSTSTGAAYLVYGRAAWYSGTTALSGSVKYVGEAAGDAAGAAVASAGDVNGDGNADFLIGAPGNSAGAGAAYLVLGQGAATFFADADDDGYGDPDSSSPGCFTPPAGYTTDSSDCNDSDPTTNPGAIEFCESGTDADQVDNDCSGSHDDPFPPIIWAEDSDNDTYGNDLSTIAACVPPPSSHWVPYDVIEPGPTDCNDTDSVIYPGAHEACDAKDNDCDAQADEDPVLFYVDADGDGFGSTSRFPPTTALCTSQPANHVQNNDDCNDANSQLNPHTVWYQDSDNDGFGASTSTLQSCLQPAGHSPNALDCDDTNNTISDGITWYRDHDGDGHGGFPLDTARSCIAPASYVAAIDDCRDTDASIHPGMIESCDGIDNDCNGTIDEGATSTVYADFDGDGFGGANPAFTRQACIGLLPVGYAATNDDCNDFDPAISPATTWYADTDADGHGDQNPAVPTLQSCTAPGNHSRLQDDCNDSRSDVHPGHVETCEATGPQIDNDCDGAVDDASNTVVWHVDADGDTYGKIGEPTLVACAQPDGYVANGVDCDDTMSNVYPGAVEVCEPGGLPEGQVDNDCDGDLNDAEDAPLYLGDSDTSSGGDGYGALPYSVKSCILPALRPDITGPYVLDVGPRDCDNNNASIHPGATEVCNQRDDDCDGTVDEEVVPKWYIDNDRDGCGSPVSSSVPPISPISSCGHPGGGCNYAGPIYVLNNLDPNDNLAGDCTPP